MGGAQVRRLGRWRHWWLSSLSDCSPLRLRRALMPGRCAADDAVPDAGAGAPQGYSADPEPPAQWAPESGVDVPPGAVAFASPDPSSQITYTISPPGYRCNAHGSYSSSSGPVQEGVGVYSPGDAVPVWDAGAEL